MIEISFSSDYGNDLLFGFITITTIILGVMMPLTNHKDGSNNFFGVMMENMRLFQISWHCQSIHPRNVKIEIASANKRIYQTI